MSSVHSLKPLVKAMSNVMMSILLISLASTSYADLKKHPTGQKVPAYLEPIMLIQEAEKAVISTKDGVQRLTLQGMHPLIAYTGALKDKRVFGAFVAEKAPYSWNMCNRLKDKLKTWQPDERNSLLIYESGPANGDKAAYRSDSVLYTAHNEANPQYSTAGNMGMLPLFLDQSSYDKPSKRYRFVVEEGKPINGVYHKIMLLTECFGH